MTPEVTADGPPRPGAPEASANPEASALAGRVAMAEVAGGCLFALGLLLLLLGASTLGIVLWIACVVIDWRILARVREAVRRATSAADRARLEQYVSHRVTLTAIAQLMAAAIGLLLIGTHPGLAVTVWIVTGTGFALNRTLARIGSDLRADGMRT